MGPIIDHLQKLVVSVGCLIFLIHGCMTSKNFSEGFSIVGLQPSFQKKPTFVRQVSDISNPSLRIPMLQVEAKSILVDKEGLVQSFSDLGNLSLRELKKWFVKQSSQLSMTQIFPLDQKNLKFSNKKAYVYSFTHPKKDIIQDVGFDDFIGLTYGTIFFLPTKYEEFKHIPFQKADRFGYRVFNWSNSVHIGARIPHSEDFITMLKLKGVGLLSPDAHGGGMLSIEQGLWELMLNHLVTKILSVNKSPYKIAPAYGLIGLPFKIGKIELPSILVTQAYNHQVKKSIYTERKFAQPVEDLLNTYGFTTMSPAKIFHSTDNKKQYFRISKLDLALDNQTIGDVGSIRLMDTMEPYRWIGEDGYESCVDKACFQKSLDRLQEGQFKEPEKEVHTELLSQYQALLEALKSQSNFDQLYAKYKQWLETSILL